MALVTLEGSVTPSTFLARGARLTVERTPYIDKLITRGYVVVVEKPTPKISDPVTVQDTMTEVEQYVQDAPARARIERRSSPPIDAPAAGALKTVWQKFLDEKAIVYPASATKLDLIRLWNAVASAAAVEEIDGGTDD